MQRLQLPEQGLLCKPACRSARSQGHPERQEHPRFQGPGSRKNHQRRNRRADPEEPAQADRHGIRAFDLLWAKRQCSIPRTFAGTLPRFPGTAPACKICLQAKMVHPVHPPD